MDHPDPLALQQEVKRLLEESQPDEQRARAYYAERPELFAHQSFEQSRPAIERILRVRMTRAALLRQAEADLPHVEAPLHHTDPRFP